MPTLSCGCYRLCAWMTSIVKRNAYISAGSSTPSTKEYCALFGWQNTMYFSTTTYLWRKNSCSVHRSVFRSDEDSEENTNDANGTRQAEEAAVSSMRRNLSILGFNLACSTSIFRFNLISCWTVSRFNGVLLRAANYSLNAKIMVYNFVSDELPLTIKRNALSIQTRIPESLR